MATTPLSLKSLLSPSKTTEVEYPGFPGFKIHVAFLLRETMVNMRKKASKSTFKNRQVSEELDDKLFLQLYVQAAIKGWSGLKLEYLSQLAPVDLGTHGPEEELDYSEENALFLMQNSANFDAFIVETVTDLTNFSNNSPSV